MRKTAKSVKPELGLKLVIVTLLTVTYSKILLKIQYEDLHTCDKKWQLTAKALLSSFSEH